MTASLLYRVREFSAERCRWIQYPAQRLLPARPRAPIFTYSMPWPQRLLIAYVALLVLAFCSIGLLLLCILGWATVTA